MLHDRADVCSALADIVTTRPAKPCTSVPQVMFLGMSLCLPLAYWQQWKARKLRQAGNGADEPLLSGGVVRTNPLACQLIT